MALELILGSAHSGKTELLCGELVAASVKQQPALLLPSGPDVRRAQEAFARDGVAGVRCLTFDKWLEELWVLHGDGSRLIGPAARAAAVEEVLSAERLVELAETAMTVGFGVLLADVAKRLDGSEAATHRGTLGELTALVAGYRRRLAQLGLIESTMAAAALAADPPALPGPIGVNLFSDLTRAQEGLLVALSVSNDVVVALSWEEGRAATTAIDPLVERLKVAGARCVVARKHRSRDADLADLQDRLFEGLAAGPVPHSVAMGTATGQEAECALVARLARRAVEEGVAPGYIAVAFRDVASRRTMLRAAFDAEGVPATLDVSLPFTKTPYGAALGALMDVCALRGDTRERAITYLMSPYSGVDPETVAECDAIWRVKRRSATEVRASVQRLSPGGGLVKLAVGLAGEPVAQGSLQNWEKLTVHLLRNGLAHAGRTADQAAVDAAARRGLLRAVSEIAASGGATEAGLRRALRSVRVSAALVEQEGNVLITEAHRLQGRTFDTLIVGGLTADEFSPQADDSLATVLCERLGDPKRIDRGLRERLLFHTITTRADRRLVLVRQTTDERGEPLRSSVFWDEVLDLYRSPEAAAEGVWPVGLARESLSLSDLADAAPVYTPGRRAQRATACDRAPFRPARGVPVGDVAELCREREEFSVSEIETYIACPYQWFYQRVLKPKEIDTAFDARERGSLAHDLLATFYGMWRHSGHGRISPDELGDARAMLEQAAGTCLSRTRRVPKVDLADELSESRALRWAQAILEDDVSFLPGFTPEHHEFRFGSRCGRPVEIGGVRLVGSIDRIDVSARGLVVVDYKSTSILAGRRSFGGKGLLQAPVYAGIAEELLARPAVGGLYRSLTTLQARGFWLDGEVELGGRGTGTDRAGAEEIRHDIDSAVERLAEAAEGMRSGDIAPRPLMKAVCERCEARDVCGEAR